MTLIYGVSENAPLNFMNTWIEALMFDGKYKILNITSDSFTISTEFQCLGHINISEKVIKRNDVNQIKF